MTWSNMKQFFIGIFASLCVSLSVCAQAKFSVHYTDTVNMAEAFEIKYLVEENTDFELTPRPVKVNSEAMKIMKGPICSTQTSTAMTNGKVKNHKSISFGYHFMCFKPGTYQVPVLSVVDSVGNEMLFPDDLTFYVRKGEKQSSSSKYKMPATNIKPRIGDLIESVAVVDKQKISLGDSVKCQIYLYTNKNVDSYVSSIEIDNAMKHNIPRDCKIPFKDTIYKGHNVKYVLLDAFYIIPLQSGEIKIEGQYCFEYVYQNPNVDPIYAFFSGGSYIKNDTIVKFKPLYVTVRPSKLQEEDFVYVEPKTTPNIAVVVDRSSSLYTREDTMQMNYYQMENVFLEKFLSRYNKNYETIVFAGHPYKIRNEELKLYADSITNFANDGSAVYDAVLRATITGGTNQSVLLLTDGADNSSRISANTLIDLLLEKGIRVDVVAFASNNDSVYHTFRDSIDTNKDDKYEDVKFANIYDRNEQKLDEVRRIAEVTGGAFVQVCNETQISEAVRQIQNSVSSSGRQQKKQRRGSSQTSLYLINYTRRYMIYQKSLFRIFQSLQYRVDTLKKHGKCDINLS